MTIVYRPGGVTVTIGRSQTVEVPPRVYRVRLTGFLFETDKTFLLPAAMHGIRGLIDYYQKHPGMTLVVTGHTDTVGDATYNVALSDERVVSMAHYLRDEVDPWLQCYQGSPNSKVWGTREDQYMLTAIDDDAGRPFYAGPVHGQLDGATRDAVTRFQGARGLAVDGQPGPETRRALVTDYMNLDGTTLPASATLDTLGCGENHLELPTADGTDEAINRRVEIFLFDGPPDPPNPHHCPGPGCAYPEWKHRAQETIDFDHDKPKSSLRIRLLDPLGRAYGGARYRVLIANAKVAEGVAQGDGWFEAEVDPSSEACEVEWGAPDEIDRLEGVFPYRARTFLIITDDDDEAIARKQLHNLGYSPGMQDDLEYAVGRFQSDWHLPESGQLDGPTKAKLTMVHDEAPERA